MIETLLLDYINTINDIEVYRKKDKPSTIHCLDEKRAEIHEKIYQHLKGGTMPKLRYDRLYTVTSRLDEAIGFTPPLKRQNSIEIYTRLLLNLINSETGQAFLVGESGTYRGTDGILKGY